MLTVVTQMPHRPKPKELKHPYDKPWNALEVKERMDRKAAKKGKEKEEVKPSGSS